MRVTATRRTRRHGVALVALTAAGALALTACSGDSGAMPSDEGGGDDGNVEIRFAWWGSDDRHQTTQEIIDLFEDKNPGITVTPDFTDWDGYWDKLATATAAGDTPDVMTQEERYLSEYASQGIIADLAELGVDTADIPEETLATGTIDDALYGVATGVNAYALVADPQIFADAGVEMPDDTTWTWEDYVEIAGQVAEGAGDGVWGAQDYGFNEAGLAVLARQKGETLYTEDGGLGVSKETVAEFFQVSLDLMANGGQPDASRSVEYQNAGPEGSLLGTNSGAMGVWWSNQLGALSDASGHELELLRLPGESQFERTGMYFKPAMYYSISATTEHPEESAKFVDFLLNDPEVAALQLTDRGLPSNTTVRESVLGDLTAADQKVADFMADLEDEVVDNPPVPPQGSSDMQDIMIRINTQVLFEEITPEEAADLFLKDVGAAISG
ncbi:extracellular solute-binding protein [Isoptericola hypogeus]|uniref:Extracellular solute-binding protein n=1 Tax=Isoptericola hypogeus TaxID=300179 RepID=A0ABN2J3Y3_9MICO